MADDDDPGAAASARRGSVFAAEPSFIRICHNSLCRCSLNPSACRAPPPAKAAADARALLFSAWRALFFLAGLAGLLYLESSGVASAATTFKGVDAAAARAPAPAPAPADPVAAHVREPRLFLVWTKDMSYWNWVFAAVVESIFHYHPRAHVTFFSDGRLPQDFFACFSDAGYDVRVEYYDLKNLSRGTAVEALVDSGRIQGSKFRYAHESDLVRILVLKARGGAYTDTDTLFLNAMDEHVLGKPSLGLETMSYSTAHYHDANSTRLNNAFINFPLPNHPFLDCMMENIAPNYDPGEWAAIGPDLVTSCHAGLRGEWKENFRILPPNDLYPLDWKWAWWVASVRRRADVDFLWPPGQRELSYAMHLYNSNSWNMQDIHVNGGSVGGFEIMDGPLRGSLLEELIAKSQLTDAKCEHLRRKGSVPPGGRRR